MNLKFDLLQWGPVRLLGVNQNQINKFDQTHPCPNTKKYNNLWILLESKICTTGLFPWPKIDIMLGYHRTNENRSEWQQPFPSFFSSGISLFFISSSLLSC